MLDSLPVSSVLTEASLSGSSDACSAAGGWLTARADAGLLPRRRVIGLFVALGSVLEGTGGSWFGSIKFGSC